MILELQAVSKSFGALKAADAIAFDVEEGEALGIIGPNGAGKSTLFSLISSAQQRCLAGIGRSHQIPAPFERLTVFENLLVAACFGRGKREAEVVQSCGDILEATGLLTKANRIAGSLSLLDRKRLEMARALATQPRLLLLDEIAGGLTEGECQELVAAIRKIHASGTTILWIEHIVHALLAVVSRLVVLNFGRMIAQGDPREVMDSAQVREIYLGSPI